MAEILIGAVASLIASIVAVLVSFWLARRYENKPAIIADVVFTPLNLFSQDFQWHISRIGSTVDTDGWEVATFSVRNVGKVAVQDVDIMISTSEYDGNVSLGVIEYTESVPQGLASRIEREGAMNFYGALKGNIAELVNFSVDMKLQRLNPGESLDHYICSPSLESANLVVRADGITLEEKAQKQGENGRRIEPSRLTETLRIVEGRREQSYKRD